LRSLCFSTLRFHAQALPQLPGNSERGCSLAGTVRHSECPYGLSRLFCVQGCAQDADGEMGEVRGFVIELDPADDAMLFEVIADLGFADSEMFGEPRAE
jgi:hypothetical protein